jgi:Co/Zn/Cd efflux system component
VGLFQPLPVHICCNNLPHAAATRLHKHVKLQQTCFPSSLTFALHHVQVQRKLVIACVLCFIFMIVEIVGGYIAKR